VAANKAKIGQGVDGIISFFSAGRENRTRVGSCLSTE
jgi:hypothetical protein